MPDFNEVTDMQTPIQRKLATDAGKPGAITTEQLEQIFKELGVDANTVVVDLNDIDDTVFTKAVQAKEKIQGMDVYRPTKHLISPVMVAAMERNRETAKKFGATYAGFCLFSHRGLGFDFRITESEGQRAMSGVLGSTVWLLRKAAHECRKSIKHTFKFEGALLKDFDHVDPDDCFNPRVAANLTQLTGAKCLGIGTIDDLVAGRKFGEGYESCKKWYADLFKAKKIINGIPVYFPVSCAEYKFNPEQNSKSKRAMHELVQEKMRELFLGKKILLIYNDDREDLCLEALGLEPKADIAYLVFQHYATMQWEPIYQGYTSAFQPAKQLTSPAQTLVSLGVDKTVLAMVAEMKKPASTEKDSVVAESTPTSTSPAPAQDNANGVVAIAPQNAELTQSALRNA